MQVLNMHLKRLLQEMLGYGLALEGIGALDLGAELSGQFESLKTDSDIERPGRPAAGSDGGYPAANNSARSRTSAISSSPSIAEMICSWRF